jgi:hypothetical protein
MKEHSIIKLSTMWSSESLRRKTEDLVNDVALDGYEIVSVAFGVNVWMMPTAYVTISK